MKSYKELYVFFEDLNDLKIHYYLKSTHFSRIRLTNDLFDIWESYLEELVINADGKTIPTVSHTDAFSHFLIDYYDKDSSKFQFIVKIVLIDLIENSPNEINLSNVIKDLRLLKFDSTYLREIETVYLNHQNERLVSNNKKSNNKDKEKSSNISFEIKKKDWKKAIAKSEIEKVVDDIIDFGVDNENDIIALSSRWNSLQNKYHKGVMKDDDFSIENNKIVNALLDFIKNMKNTEGV